MTPNTQLIVFSESVISRILYLQAGNFYTSSRLFFAAFSSHTMLVHAGKIRHYLQKYRILGIELEGTV